MASARTKIPPKVAPMMMAYFIFDSFGSLVGSIQTNLEQISVLFSFGPGIYIFMTVTKYVYISQNVLEHSI